VKRRLAAVIAAVASLVPAVARGEPIAPLVHVDQDRAVGDTAVYLSTGLDGAVAATAGAALGVARAGARLSLVGWGDVTWAAGNLDFDDVRYRIGVRVDALRRGRLRLRAGFAPALRTAKTDAFGAQSVGTELHLLPGVDAERFSAELDGALDAEWLTRIAPSDVYRQNVYAGARAGWYRTTALTPRVGAGVSMRIGAFELMLRAGWERTGSFDFLPPLYASLGAAWRI
jgi:hypothetical protein